MKSLFRSQRGGLLTCCCGPTFLSLKAVSLPTKTVLSRAWCAQVAVHPQHNERPFCHIAEFNVFVCEQGIWRAAWTRVRVTAGVLWSVRTNLECPTCGGSSAGGRGVDSQDSLEFIHRYTELNTWTVCTRVDEVLNHSCYCSSIMLLFCYSSSKMILK